MSKDTRYFPHDENAHDDFKIKAMIKTYGIEGYGRYWIVIERMRASAHYRLEDKQFIWEALSDDLHCSPEKVLQYINDCIEKFSLFKRDNGFIYSPSLILRMSKLDDLRQKRAKGGYARHGKTIPEDWE